MELASLLEIRGDIFTEYQVRSSIDTVPNSAGLLQRDDDWIAVFKANGTRRSELILNLDGHVGQFAYGVTLIMPATPRIWLVSICMSTPDIGKAICISTSLFGCTTFISTP